MRRNWPGIFIILAFFLACPSRERAGADSLVIGVESHPEQLDPRLGNDALSSKVKKLIFPGLLALDDRQELVPELAKSMTHKDGMHYTIELKENIVFHDGSKLTSADVRSTFESLQDPDFAAPHLGEAAYIDWIETPSEQRVIFHLKRPYLSFPTLLTVGILPSQQALAYREGKRLVMDALVGAGAFRLKPGSLGPDRLTLYRHDAYYGGPAVLARVIFWTLTDNTLRALELMKGRIDLVQNAVPYALVPKLSKTEGLAFDAVVGTNFNYLAFNFRRPIFRDLRIRQAFAHAIDVDAILKYKMPGLARRADSLLNPKHWAYRADLGRYDFNPTRAKALLDEAGFPDPDGEGPQTRFNIVYKTSTDKQRLEIVQVLAAQLRAIGVGVTIRTYELATLFKHFDQGDFDIMTMARVGISDPDVYFTSLHSTQIPPTGRNRGAYSHRDLDDLLQQSRTETDPARRTEIFHRIQKLVFDDLPYVPLWYENNFVLRSDRVKGYRPRPDSGFLGVLGTTKS